MGLEYERCPSFTKDGLDCIYASSSSPLHKVLLSDILPFLQKINKDNVFNDWKLGKISSGEISKYLKENPRHTSVIVGDAIKDRLSDPGVWAKAALGGATAIGIGIIGHQISGIKGKKKVQKAAQAAYANHKQSSTGKGSSSSSRSTSARGSKKK